MKTNPTQIIYLAPNSWERQELFGTHFLLHMAQNAIFCDVLREERRGTRNGYEASKGISGL